MGDLKNTKQVNLVFIGTMHEFYYLKYPNHLLKHSIEITIIISSHYFVCFWIIYCSDVDIRLAHISCHFPSH